MKLKESLAADYWLENTKKIYEENLHVSSPVMDAYKAGFEKAKELVLDLIPLTAKNVRTLGEEE